MVLQGHRFCLRSNDDLARATLIWLERNHISFSNSLSYYCVVWAWKIRNIKYINLRVNIICITKIPWKLWNNGHIFCFISIRWYSSNSFKKKECFLIKNLMCLEKLQVFQETDNPDFVFNKCQNSLNIEVCHRDRPQGLLNMTYSTL